MNFDDEIDKLEEKFRSLRNTIDKETMAEIENEFIKMTKSLYKWNTIDDGEEKNALYREIVKKIKWLQEQP